MSASRRRRRSVRILVASGLLALAGVVVVGAVLTTVPWVVTVAAVLAWVVAAAILAIGLDEVAQIRRAAARDRADQARRFTQITRRRLHDHAQFAGQMQRQVAVRDEELRRQGDVVIAARGRARAAERELKRTTSRLRELVAEVGTLRSECEQVTGELTVARQQLEQPGPAAEPIKDHPAWATAVTAITLDRRDSA